MSIEHRCWCCQGSKQVMSGGCIFKECHVCSGTGKIYAETTTLELKPDSQTHKVEMLPYITSPEIEQRARELSEWAAKELAKPEVNIKKKVEEDILPMIKPKIMKRPKIRKRPLHPDAILNV